VGDDIFGVCRRCGEVWHVVVAVVDGRIARVECKQCGARHSHRSDTGEPRSAAGGAHPARSGNARRSSPTRRETVEADLSRPARPYAPDAQYQAGDRVLHPSFGEGVVQAVAGPKKVLVRFASGDKTLVQARERAQGSA
jgi:predicted 2-oxoglutarate/Fe(II)-dependent dioxygenase YbiX